MPPKPSRKPPVKVEARRAVEVEAPYAPVPAVNVVAPPTIVNGRLVSVANGVMVDTPPPAVPVQAAPAEIPTSPLARALYLMDQRRKLFR